MNNLAKKISAYLNTVKGGDSLGTKDLRLIDEAFEAIRSAAHRHWAQQPRGSRLINELRAIIDKYPDWSAYVTPLEYRVISAKFGSAPHLAGEISNTAVGERLEFTKQTVAHHLKTAHAKLREHFGAIEISDEANSRKKPAEQPAEKSESPGLMEDAEWQSLAVWRRSLIISGAVTGEDLIRLQQLESRLKSVTVETKKSQADDPPRRRSSPNRFFELRAALIENESLLERVTPRQREVLIRGLALDETDIDERSELGFRRFPESDAMTFQNFNYFVRESLKRMKLNL